MKCQSCNCNLSDFESTRKHAITGAFIDMCNGCFKSIKYIIPVVEREDLLETEESSEENDLEEFEYDEQR